MKKNDVQNCSPVRVAVAVTAVCYYLVTLCLSFVDSEFMILSHHMPSLPSLPSSIPPCLSATILSSLPFRLSPYISLSSSPFLSLSFSLFLFLSLRLPFRFPYSFPTCTTSSLYLPHCTSLCNFSTRSHECRQLKLICTTD